MTWFDGARALNRVHEVHPELKSTARQVLAVMISMVGDSERDKTDPCCFASRETIAKRVGCKRLGTVTEAWAELERVGAIERAGQAGSRLHGTVRWRLPVLAVLRRLPKHRAETTQEQRAETAQEQRAETAHNPSDSYRPPGREERGRSDAADADASAGATATATASAMAGGSGIVAEIMAQHGSTQGAAEAWIKRQFAKAPGTVWNETPYLRECLRREADAASSSAKKSNPRGARAKSGKPPEGVPSPKQKAGALRRQGHKRRPREEFTPEEMQGAADEVARLRAEDGLSHQKAVIQVADEKNVAQDAVNGWTRRADQLAADGGSTLAEDERERRRRYEQLRAENAAAREAQRAAS